ncbi:MAG: hypothetical protein AAFP22_02450, partial [Planctomycetota bacterium]
MNRLPGHSSPDSGSDGDPAGAARSASHRAAPAGLRGSALDPIEASVRRALAEAAREEEIAWADPAPTGPEEHAFLERTRATLAEASEIEELPAALGSRPRQALLTAGARRTAGDDRGLRLRWAAAALVAVTGATALALRDRGTEGAGSAPAHDQYLGAPSTETPAKDRASLFTGTVDWRVAHERDFTAGAVEYTVEVFGIDDGVERSLWTSDVLLEPEWICTAEFQRELPAT